jgi:hypothetical protein
MLAFLDVASRSLEARLGAGTGTLQRIKAEMAAAV